MHFHFSSRPSILATAALSLALGAYSRAQAPVQPPHHSAFLSLTTIPVPYDPLEVVTGDARVVQNAEERAAAIDLLEKARRLSNVRLHPYDLKTTFTSYGSSSSDGRWVLEDMSPGANIYRWTAQGPSFSGIFLNANKLLSSNQAGGAMPLRLAQVRDAMWAIYYPAIGPHATLRVANGSLNGTQLRCVLVAHGIYGTSEPEFSSGRSFDEAEYCVNPQTGLLEMHSPYAGLYIHYDYSNSLHFHEQIIPDGFTITERGKAVIEARTESVSEAPPANSNLFEAAGLSALGVGQAIVAPMMVRGIQTSQSSEVGSAGQVVVVHGMVSPDGHLSEVEVLASTNPSFEEVAMDHVNKASALEMGVNTQPGTTPQSREVVFTVEFVPRPAPTAAPLGIQQ
jgi:hypothetical protein